MSAPEVAPASLRSQVHRAIIDLIRRDRLGPGDRLPSTAALSERFEVSRPVVREALSALQAIGAIEISNGRAPVVRQLDGHLIGLFLSLATNGQSSDLLALAEVRAPLEVQAAVLAAMRASSAESSALVDQVERMAAFLDDAPAYVQHDLDFHRRIAELSGNPILLWVVDAVRWELRDAMLQLRAVRESLGRVGEEQHDHHRIAAAIAAGDPVAAEAAMREHMARAEAMAPGVFARPARRA